MTVLWLITAIYKRVGVTIVPTRPISNHSTLEFKQCSFHLAKIALGSTPV